MSGSYQDLAVYQQAHSLGIEVHRFTLKLPKFELYEAGSQLHRASKSVSVNMVEGYGRRRYKQEFIRFLIYAQASGDETAEWLAYLRELYPEMTGDSEQLGRKIEELGRRLNKFIQAVETSHPLEK